MTLGSHALTRWLGGWLTTEDGDRLETAHSKRPREGKGNCEVNTRVLPGGQGCLQRLFLPLALRAGRQREEVFVVDGLQDTSKVASQENQHGLFFPP